MAYDGHLTTLPMCQYLDRALGEDYVALALTSTADHTVEMYPDPDAALGFTIAEHPFKTTTRARPAHQGGT
ncbi:hypothetical protein [Streptosporangium sandarakinum]|uniref:hypothetical protein n=1 Tax=Streptosporangium sandarakinum TaxID=1260955 RepID=UPI00367F9942